ncbi:DNA-binding protein [Desulfofundulus thermobenzoicus]|uniref:DNA-binding protein n=1 Tax=Desulfofundulus thermobenzoicus TaxID=29376 RepID=A0A6N7IRR9_9FIRM|nr:HU family DNA-binding protein [Desulfofundulus thermobenzoicus]MQL51828.1 DNA-binding protein [Desulfofundulus thermobenzoicus]
MTKGELIDVVANKTGNTKKVAAKVVDAVLATLEEAVRRGEEVRIAGFGAFLVKERAERQARNPQTGESISIPARKAVVFRPGKELRAAVN